MCIIVILTMESNLNEFEQERPSRPTLLTVLCILSFIGSSWTIVTDVYSYATANVTVQAFAKVRVDQNDSDVKKDTAGSQDTHKRILFRNRMMGSLQKMMTPDNIRKSSLGSFIAALFTLAGALLMWWLRRPGFYLYIVGVLLALIVPFYLYGNNLLAVGLSSVTTFFGLVFIALYALNIKNLH
jgi:hypothetical protein